jgi:hypothetical protein
MNEFNKSCINIKIPIEAKFVGADFSLFFDTKEPIIITKINNEELYNSLNEIMNNDYQFDSSSLSYKHEKEICWFSDQYCDIDDKTQTDRVNRLFIRLTNLGIELNVVNPYFEKNGINNKSYLISFSPSGNGLYSINKNTGLTFQDDIIIAFRRIISYEEYSNNPDKYPFFIKDGIIVNENVYKKQKEKGMNR